MSYNDQLEWLISFYHRKANTQFHSNTVQHTNFIQTQSSHPHFAGHLRRLNHTHPRYPELYVQNQSNKLGSGSNAHTSLFSRGPSAFGEKCCNISVSNRMFVLTISNSFLTCAWDQTTVSSIVPLNSTKALYFGPNSKRSDKQGIKRNPQKTASPNNYE